MKNALGIDVGYGHTKWVSISEEGEIKRGSFLSVAPLTTKERCSDLTGMSSLKAVTVAVDGNNYVVGKDARLEADSNYSRSRLANYSQTPGYHALMLGAMSICGLREIDQLVIGLPLSTASTYGSALVQKYRCEHLIGSTHAKRKIEVNVKNVTVNSQPAGAMIYAVSLNPELRKSTNLVIDIGYFTMDFLICEGMKPSYARSGAVQGGMSSYYDHLESLVVEKLIAAGLPSANGVDHFRLEQTISGPAKGDDGVLVYNLQVGNKVLDVSECVQRAQSKLVEYIDRMMTAVGGKTFGSIKNVLLAGGGAQLLKPVVEKMMGDTHNYYTMENAQFAVANGYAQFGHALNLRSQAIATE